MEDSMLALGADAVLIGRDVIRAIVGAGSLGVKYHMERLHQTLRHTMKMTGCGNPAAIEKEILL